MSSANDNPKPVDDAADDEGKTAHMPRYHSEGEDATIVSSDVSTDEGETKLMPQDEGATKHMPRHPAGQDETGEFAVDSDEGDTRLMPDYPHDEAPADAAETVVSRPGEDPTIASSPDLAPPQEDLTVASSDSLPKASDTPTRVRPNIKQTQPGPAPTDTIIDANKKLLQKRYRLDEVLGKGGFGAAYLATDVKLNRECVVKQMLTPKDVSPAQLELYRANFEREARLLVQLNTPGHPNIPEIYDYFTDASGNYLVMKFIKGGSLADVLGEHKGAIPWREAVRYMIDMCDALNYMHKREEPIMHRDIKPANILLSKEDNRVWLVDFGLAKADPNVESVGGAEASLAAGTQGYTPLEQWLGEAEPASDIYALGATLHHLVTGLRPSEAFEGQFNIQKVKELQGQFKPIRKVNKELPKALEEAISRATAADTQQRITAPQLKQELDTLIAGAQAAALYTFKSGESANDEKELVDLCDKYKAEARKYLYDGDFERWFRLINRNDLADAADRAVQQGKNQSDGLQKFLKLILPNLFLRRISRAGGRVGRVTVVAVLAVIIMLVLLVIGGSYGAGWFLQQSVASYPWNFNNLSQDEAHRITEEQVNIDAQSIAGVYFDELTLDMRPTNEVNITGNWAGIGFTLPVLVEVKDGKPTFQLSSVNSIPLWLIGDNVSAGINAGVSDAFQQSPYDIAGLTVNDNEIVIEAEVSGQSGRPAVPTATPSPTPKPTATAIPTATSTPEGLALVTIFNETGRDIILDIEGELIEMEVGDSEVIEKKPGTYSYTVTFKDTGAVGAEGEKNWGVEIYKWRIGGDE